MSANETKIEKPKLESNEVVLVHCNLILFTIVLNEQYGELVKRSHHSLTKVNTENSEFSFSEAWFTGKNSNPLKIEHSEYYTDTWLEIKNEKF